MFTVEDTVLVTAVTLVAGRGSEGDIPTTAAVSDGYPQSFFATNFNV